MNHVIVRQLCVITLAVLILACSAVFGDQKDELFPEGIISAIQIKDDLREGQLEQAKKNIEDLKSTDQWVREWAEQRLLAIHTSVVKGLIKIVEDESADQAMHGPLYRSVALLGAYRAPEGIGALVGRLTYLPSLPDRVRPVEEEYEGYYPCAKALVSIGLPARDKMTSIIGGSSNELERALAAWVLVKIEGKEQAVSLLDRYAKKLTDNRWRENILKARDYAASYAPRTDHPYSRPL
ncbi:MAG: hypothetical protein GX139_07265 [Armatimonadetes bacterium]|jgi:hypothetical protein|nr:hypothetical protein [Armatimonadota bacterium]